MAVSKASLHVPLEAPLIPSSEQYVHKTAAIGYTDYPKSDLSFIWKVIVKPLRNGRTVESPTFKVPLHNREDDERGGNRSSVWHLMLQSSGHSYNVFLCFKGEKVENVDPSNLVTAQSQFCIADCVFSALNPTTKVPFDVKASPKLCQNIDTSVESCFFSNKQLDELTVDGVLTMKVGASLVYFKDPIQATVEAAAGPLLSRNVFDGLKTLHKDRSFTDVTIKCGEKEFKAHKAILAPQSPIFDRMFENDMKDNVVEVTDIDPDVMSDMLDFLYTGRVPNLHTLAKKLLHAASKYELPQLVVLCENELMLNLYVDNLFEMAQCADTCGAVNLKQACLRMIKSNSVELFKSGAWKDFKATSQQDLVYEVLEFKGLEFVEAKTVR